jgi:DNA-binding PucR family transcriptional regulator
VGGDADLPAIPRCRGSLRIAIGRLGRGLDGFRRTHQEALLAKRVASLSERPSLAAVSFGNVALESLLTADVDEARRFVHAELGPLMEDSDASRRLASTLEVFLQEESSFVRTARRLGIHENTVAYRVRRAEELLGHRAAERQLELRAALRLAAFVRGETPDA